MLCGYKIFLGKIMSIFPILMFNANVKPFIAGHSLQFKPNIQVKYKLPLIPTLSAAIYPHKH